MKLIKPNFWDKKQISLFSILLLPITWLVELLSLINRFLTKTHHYSIPIICVGNIYLGGTGKTPISIEIFSILKKLNKNPVFIRKKYDAFNDEIAIQKQFGPIYQSKKRIDAIKNAIQNNADVAVLDDGFQDFSIKKDLSIICFNEKQWIGNGYIIPAGPLREKLVALKRANCVIINGKKNIDIENKILEQNNYIKIFYSKYQPKNIYEFRNKKVIAFAGIGNPINFFNLLKDNDVNISEEIKFPDHHNFSEKELKNLIIKAEKKNSILLTTEKDYLRIKENYRKNINFIKIEVKMENQNQFIDEIKKII